MLNSYNIEVEAESIHPKELKFYRHCQHQIDRIKALEVDKHNPPMFSSAAIRLAGCLKELFDSKSNVRK